jgi:cell division protein FtsN
MARDYKNRGQSRAKNSRKQKGLGAWRWAAITALIISFVVFLVYLRMNASSEPEIQEVARTRPEKTDKNASQTPVEAKKQESKQAQKPKTPHFEFYTILPEKEVVIPEYEIKTRTREERVGKAKEGKYIMQAGSFKTFKEADQLKAKLALMGIESKVEKAKVGDSTWNRVKMGPYTQMASVDSIRSRLKKNGVDVVVTEVSAKGPNVKKALAQNH